MLSTTPGNVIAGSMEDEDTPKIDDVEQIDY